MAHWAQIDKNNKVIQVTVGNNDDLNDGYDWLVNNLGGIWIQTSYNSHGGVHYMYVEENGIMKYVPSGKPHLRFNYAGIGFTYDETRNAFIPPKPEEGEWVLNEQTCYWESKVID